jgi:PRTRC genetic system protein C
MPGTTLATSAAVRRVVAHPIVRVFMFAGMTLQDPLPGRPPKLVRATHALLHPQIANAKIEGPVYVGHQEQWTYVPQTGTNG